ncbi:hypothetical protein [Pseudomonas phage fMGyn-Pae01]|nr:hypothetical protein [Pseudomonas phage fMGyn-Pae01]
MDVVTAIWEDVLMNVQSKLKVMATTANDVIRVVEPKLNEMIKSNINQLQTERYSISLNKTKDSRYYAKYHDNHYGWDIYLFVEQTRTGAIVGSGLRHRAKEAWGLNKFREYNLIKVRCTRQNSVVDSIVFFDDPSEYFLRAVNKF